MRKNILVPGRKELRYIIREIVDLANKVDKKVYWENIGDPVQKGEKIPNWMKSIIKNACEKDEVYGYSPTRGLDKTLEYIISKNPKLSKKDIIFFNGIGDAINKIYKALSFDSRIIGPNPAYPTHSSTEASHANSFHLTYNLDPNNNWFPNMEDLENKVKYNPNIVGILVINPDNPTGAVFPKKVMKKFIEICKKYNLFLIVDEIYEKLVFNKKDYTPLAEVVDEDICAISMKGISKDLPWPGGRCGWIEVYNADKDENFRKYIDTLLALKMVEVCSTTLPQYVLPELYEAKEYKQYLKERLEKYRKRADLAEKILSDSKELKFTKPKGTFYLTILFDKINKNKKIKIENKKIDELIKSKIDENTRFDEKFCYYLLAETGVCVVPLSGFNSSYDGFRITLLEESEDKFIEILNLIKNFAKLYKI